jgi:putative endonuclease
MTPPPLLGDVSNGQSYVYLLKSVKDKNYYLGWTTDLKRRLDEHNRGLVTSTKSRTPFELIGYEIYPNNSLAKMRERKLKHNPNMFYCFKKRARLCSSLSETKKEVVG